MPEAGRSMRDSRNAAAVLACVIAAFASGASAAGKTAAAGDITGVWMVQEPYFLGHPLKPSPILTPEALALRKKRQEAVEKGYVRSLSNMMCQGGGGPALSMMRSPFEVMQGFGRITFIFETENFNQPRTVYLKQAKQPDNIFPTANGHSIGRWEGKTLVVDTVGFSGRSSFPGGVNASEAAHMVERFSVSADGKVLSDEITMTDPRNLAQTWTTTLKYDRMADTEERFEVTCEPDLDAVKTLDLPALKDADPEVARMLNPDTRPTDPALKIAAKPN
jgi:hypothetical protein